MAITLNRTTLNAYLRTVLGAPTGLPKTIGMMIGLFPPFDVDRTILSQAAPGAGETASLIQARSRNSGTIEYGQRTSAGGYYDGLGSAGDTYYMATSIANTGFVLKPFFIVAVDNNSFQYFGPGFPTGKTVFNPNPGNAGELAACTDLIIGALLSGAAYSGHLCMSVGEIVLWDDARTAANYTAYAAGTPGETINPATLRAVWPLNNPGTAGAAAPSSYTDIVNGLVLTATGDVTFAHQAHPVTRGAVITGPSGAAGAASSTANLAELATTGPTFTTSATLGGGYPTLTGADAASFIITALTSTSWRVDPATPFNFVSLPHANPFNVTFNASAAVSQTCAISITNVNEAPSFSGTVSVSPLTEGVAMSAINAAVVFSDPDSGDTGTYSAVGTWPTGVTVSSGGLISGTPGAGTAATYSNLRVRRTDGGGLTADSNVFAITVSAAGAAPGVTTQPSNQTVTEGGVATFTAAFSNAPTGFAWEFSDSPYSSWSPVVGGSGATTASYTTGALSLANSGRRFRCRGTNAFGSTNTNGTAQVTVNAVGALAGFDLDTAVGCIIGNVSGSLVGLGREAAGRSITVYAKTAGTDTTVCNSGALTTNSSGRLPRWTHASLVLAAQYDLYFCPADGGKPGVRRMAAT